MSLQSSLSGWWRHQLSEMLEKTTFSSPVLSWKEGVTTFRVAKRLKSAERWLSSRGEQLDYCRVYKPIEAEIEIMTIRK